MRNINLSPRATLRKNGKRQPVWKGNEMINWLGKRWTNCWHKLRITHCNEHTICDKAEKITQTAMLGTKVGDARICYARSPTTEHREKNAKYMAWTSKSVPCAWSKTHLLCVCVRTYYSDMGTNYIGRSCQFPKPYEIQCFKWKFQTQFGCFRFPRYFSVMLPLHKVRPASVSFQTRSTMYNNIQQTTYKLNCNKNLTDWLNCY